MKKRGIRLFISIALYSIFNIQYSPPSWAENPLLKEDLAEGRVTDIMRAKKLVSRKSFFLFKAPRYGNFLEGYIRGVITDYDDRPIADVVVRATVSSMATGKKRTEQDELVLGAAEEGGKEKVFDLVPNFEPGISDNQGVYRIRFSIPIIKNRIDLRGKILYNPGWDQQHDVLGQAYEPQQKESDFRLFYDEKMKFIAFSEGTRKMVVRPVRNVGPAVSPIKLKGAEKPETAQTAKEKVQGAKTPEAKAEKAQEPKAQEKKENDDFFKGFDFGP
ncbi:MAG: hypothetical protein HY747_02790 [Elusimicrobia bacterium]|nr:hypothetical protein [Elusimicrobiota bacterium]